MSDDSTEIAKHIGTGGGVGGALLLGQWLWDKFTKAEERRQEAEWRENVTGSLASISTALALLKRDGEHDTTERARAEGIVEDLRREVERIKGELADLRGEVRALRSER